MAAADALRQAEVCGSASKAATAVLEREFGEGYQFVLIVRVKGYFTISTNCYTGSSLPDRRIAPTEFIRQAMSGGELTRCESLYWRGRGL